MTHFSVKVAIRDGGLGTLGLQPQYPNWIFLFVNSKNISIGLRVRVTLFVLTKSYTVPQQRLRFARFAAGLGLEPR